MPTLLESLWWYSLEKVDTWTWRRKVGEKRSGSCRSSNGTAKKISPNCWCVQCLHFCNIRPINPYKNSLLRRDLLCITYHYLHFKTILLMLLAEADKRTSLKSIWIISGKNTITGHMGWSLHDHAVISRQNMKKISLKSRRIISLAKIKDSGVHVNCSSFPTSLIWRF